MKIFTRKIILKLTFVLLMSFLGFILLNHSSASAHPNAIDWSPCNGQYPPNGTGKQTAWSLVDNTFSQYSGYIGDTVNATLKLEARGCHGQFAFNSRYIISGQNLNNIWLPFQYDIGTVGLFGWTPNVHYQPVQFTIQPGDNGNTNHCISWNAGGDYNAFNNSAGPFQFDGTGTDTWCFTVYNKGYRPPSEPPTGKLQITKYGPNGRYYFSEPYFNLCMAYFAKIEGSCTGASAQSPEKTLASGLQYLVYRDNNIDTNGWYIDHAQRATPGPNLTQDAYGRYQITVYTNQQNFADVYLEKYAATCSNSNIFSFRGSTTSPKAGDQFAMNFGMNNPGGITNWTWPTTKLHVKVPAGVTPISSLNGQAVGSFDWRPATRDLYIAPPSYGTIYSGQSVNYTAFFQYDAGSTPGNYAYQYNMVFPDNSIAQIAYSKYGVTTFIPNCNGTSKLVEPEYYPWLQTQKGDVISLKNIVGQEIGTLPSLLTDHPGARHGNSGNKNTPFSGSPAANQENPESYFVIAQGQTDTVTNHFCSGNLYTLGSPQYDNQESCGLRYNYSMAGINITSIKEALQTTWDQNGAGSSTTCSPYRTRSIGTGPSYFINGDLTLGCPNGGIQRKEGDYVLGGGPFTNPPIIGRGTLWVKGNLTIGKNIAYGSSGTFSNPKNLPNFAIFVEGDVTIDQSVTQIDAMIIATGKIFTCTQSTASAAACSNPLRINGLLASEGKIDFGRRWFVKENPNVNPAENIVLTGQSIILPPPGLDTRDSSIDSSLQINSGELPPRLN